MLHKRSDGKQNGPDGEAVCRRGGGTASPIDLDDVIGPNLELGGDGAVSCRQAGRCGPAVDVAMGCLFRCMSPFVAVLGWCAAELARIWGNAWAALRSVGWVASFGYLAFALDRSTL